VLGCLWTIDSSYVRLMALASETDRLLSHFRPGPELVEVTRTALATWTSYTFLLQGPRPARSLVALRRLPPAPPDTLVRAIAVVLGTAAEDRSALYELCDSDEPLVAGAANGIVSYYWENEGELERALQAARRTLEAFGRSKFPYLQAVGHSRISELSLLLERGEEARRHLTAALPVLERLGARSDLDGVRSWLVLANLQLGAVDEAEHWLEPGDVGPGGHRGHGHRPCPARPARPGRGAHRHAARQAVDDAREPGREPAALPHGAARRRRAAAGRGHDGPRPGPPERGRTGHQVGGADDRPGRALPVPAELPADHVLGPRPPGGHRR
jgi:hypothetical protein